MTRLNHIFILLVGVIVGGLVCFGLTSLAYKDVQPIPGDAGVTYIGSDPSHPELHIYCLKIGKTSMLLVRDTDDHYQPIFGKLDKRITQCQ